MKKTLFRFWAAICFLALTFAETRVCPSDPPGTAYGCAYMPTCFGDTWCGAGMKCCEHTCGDRCVAVVSQSVTTQGPCTSFLCKLTGVFGKK